MPCAPVVGTHSPSLATFPLWLLHPVTQSPSRVPWLCTFCAFSSSSTCCNLTGISQSSMSPCGSCVHSDRAGLPPEHPQAVGQEQGCVLATFSRLGASLAFLRTRSTERPKTGWTCRDHRVQALAPHRPTQNPNPVSEGASQSHMCGMWPHWVSFGPSPVPLLPAFACQGEEQLKEHTQGWECWPQEFDLSQLSPVLPARSSCCIFPFGKSVLPHLPFSSAASRTAEMSTLGFARRLQPTQLLGVPTERNWQQQPRLKG